MKWTLFITVTLFTMLCGASPKKAKNTETTSTPTELSLKQMALAETAPVEGQQTQTSATDAQVSGMLTLKDPRPEVVTRSWTYFAGLTAQTFQAEGRVSKEGSGIFNLAESNQSIMPGLELGFMTRAFQTQALLWKFGLRGKAALSTQAYNVILASGYKIDDARLNTTLFSGGPLVSLQWGRFQWLAFTFSPQFGTVNYTQTSSNDFAKFSKQAGFEAFSYGLDFAVGKSWSVFTEWSQRTLKDNTEIALQKDNFELGTKVTW